jgi:hypothetical protein
MWIVTEHGFFTFVTDRKDPEYLWLRARVRKHLEDNFPGIVVTEHPGADYLYRAKVKRVDVAEQIAQLVLDSKITSHFKDVAIKTAAPGEFGSFHNALYGFWTAMAACQPYAPYSKVPRPKVKPWTPPKGKGKAVKPGQQPIGFTGSAVYGRDYDWSDNPWSEYRPSTPYQPILEPVEFPGDEEWTRMTPEEQDAFLDAEEAALRRVEAVESESEMLDWETWLANREAAATAVDTTEQLALGSDDLWVRQEDGSYPAPPAAGRNRRRARKKAGRKKA